MGLSSLLDRIAALALRPAQGKRLEATLGEGAQSMVAQRAVERRQLAGEKGTGYSWQRAEMQGGHCPP